VLEFTAQTLTYGHINVSAKKKAKNENNYHTYRHDIHNNDLHNDIIITILLPY